MPPDVPAELKILEWLPPWQPTDADLAVELAREVGRGHPLFGRRAVAVGRRVDCDDVLFWLPDGPAALAVVHLTWTGKRERSAEWPSTHLYISVPDWADNGMRADHDEVRAIALERTGAMITACFPTVNSHGLKHLGSGWEFAAYVTTDGWVFRFPHSDSAASLFESEQRVHRLVSTVLPKRIAIPHVELVGRQPNEYPYDFAGHRFIAGVAADAVDSALMPTLATDIAAALGALHSIPETVARDAGIVEMDLDDIGRKEWLERGFAAASKLIGLDPVVDQAVTWLKQVSLPFTQFNGPLRVIHQDLSPEHLIVDPTTGHLVGILDWTDTILGDAARDFVFLVTWQGWAFAENVLRSYPHAIDPDFRERLGFMARLLSVMWLAMAYERGSDVAKLVGWVRNAFAPR